MERSPQFVDEIEALLQTHFFHDEFRSEQLYDNFGDLNPAELGSRWSIGAEALRIIASARYEKRQQAKRRAAAQGQELDVVAWNAEQRLTPLYIGRIAMEYQEEVRYLSRQLGLINTAEKVLEEENIADAMQGLRAKQKPYLEDIIRSMQLGPSRIEVTHKEGDTTTHYISGTTVIAPTAFGKTVLMGRTAYALGVGKPIEGLKDKSRPLRALIVEPTQALVNQIAGQSQDGSFGTFEKASGLKPTRYFQHEKNPHGPVTVITRDAFRQNFRDGMLDGEEYDILMIDEAHHLTAPEFLNIVLKHWRGPIYGFTATPEYNVNKDVRNILPNIINHEDTISCIQDGILNGAQLFTLLIRPEDVSGNGDTLEPQQLDQPLIEFLGPLLASGRRGIVFCESGGRSFYARNLALKLRYLKLPDGRKVNAQAIGTWNKQSSQVIQDYHDRKVDVLTTVEMSREGVDGDFDFVAIHCGVESVLKLKQIIGRGPRLSERFPHTVYVQVLAPSLDKKWKKWPTHYEAFGLEQIEQGVLIGPGILGGGGLRPEQTPYVKLSDFGDRIQGILGAINRRAIGHALLAPGKITKVPSDYIPFEAIARPAYLTDAKAKQALMLAGFDWVGVPKGRRFYRFYEPNAKDYFLDYQPPSNWHLPKAGESHKSISALAAERGIASVTMRRALRLAEEKDGVVVSPMLSASSITGYYIDVGDEALVDARLDEIVPVATKKDIRHPDLAAELGISHTSLYDIARSLNIQTTLMRELGKPPNKRYRAAEAAALRKEVEQRFPKALPTDMSRIDLAQLIGLTRNPSLSRYLTKDLEGRLVPKRTEKKRVRQKLMGHWSLEDQAEIIEHLRRNHTLPPHLISSPGCLKILALSKGSVLALLRKGGGGCSISLIGQRDTYCAPWRVVEELERKYGRHPDAPLIINYSLLPHGPDDTDPERLAYAKYVQEKLVLPAQLSSNLPTINYNKKL